MNHSTALLLVFVNACGASTPGAQNPDPGVEQIPGTTPTNSVTYSGSFGSGSGTYSINARRVLVHVPSTHSSSPALVVALHGTGAQDDVQAAMQELDALSVSETNGFILAAPASTDDGGVNADHEDGGPGWSFASNKETNADLLLIRAVIQEARRAYDVDPSRIYVVGHSNGAFFAYFVAMQLADIIAAFAENSGGLIACGKRVDCAHTAPGATSCAAVIASAPAACLCSASASSFPAQKPGGRVPRGFLKHNADDDTVSPVFTCQLAEHLGARAQTLIDGAGSHGPTNDFMAKAWVFLSSKTLAD